MITVQQYRDVLKLWCEGKIEEALELAKAYGIPGYTTNKTPTEEQLHDLGYEKEEGPPPFKKKVCECGAASLGHKKPGRAHSSIMPCPLYEE